MGDENAQQSVNETLKNIYYDIRNPACFSTVEKLYDAVDRKISKKSIREWLSSQLTYTLHRPRRKRFKRNFYNLNNINQQWQFDLIDLQSLAKENDNFKYILFVIDSFSKFVRVRPLRTKTAEEITSAMKSIIEEAGEAPHQCMSDRALEFLSKKLRNYFKSVDIKHILPSNDISKACIAERGILTVKNIIFKFLTANQTLRYIDNLQEIAKAMNAKYHRTIGMAPKNVATGNLLDVWLRMEYNKIKAKNNKKTRNEPQVGDYVRLSKPKLDVGSKGYLPNWTDALYKITAKINRNPVVYKVEDGYDKEPVDGVFYREEIQKISKPDEMPYRIDKIVKSRRRHGIKELYVLWKGHKKGSWIRESDLVN